MRRRRHARVLNAVLVLLQLVLQLKCARATIIRDPFPINSGARTEATAAAVSERASQRDVARRRCGLRVRRFAGTSHVLTHIWPSQSASSTRSDPGTYAESVCVLTRIKRT